MKLDKVLYTAHATSSGGREGRVRGDDSLDVALTTPKDLGGDGAPGTNPEQLFAAGYSAGFISALKTVAMRQRVALPADTSVAAAVGLGTMGQGYAVEVALRVTIPGMEGDAARQLVEAAHRICFYSNATRGNVDVTLEVA